MRALALALIALLSVAGLAAAAPVPSGSPAIEADPAAIRGHMAFLADDLLEGREAGTRGDALAQLYIASRFQAIGLQPAGDGGTYLQRFRVRATTLEPGSARFAVTAAGAPRLFENGGDVAIFGDALEADQRVEAPVVFAGYGIVDPARGIDDYRGLDVRGRIVALLGGPPPFLPAAEAAHHGAGETQRLAAEARGAIGVIILWTPALEQRFPFDGLRSLLGRTDLNWLRPDGTPFVAAPRVRLRAFVRGAAAEALFEGGPRSFRSVLDEARTRSPAGFALAPRVSLARRSLHDDRLTTANVAGLLPGADSALGDEVVVVTAHYDHVGIGTPVNGDAVYNGALDNAVGTAMLIEVAQRIAAAERRPRRSILFLAVGAEEKGLIGSDYFAEHPTVAREAIVANINLDGAMPFYDFRDVIAFGAEHSQMGERLAAAAAGLGLAVAPDPFPEEGIFTRSDQYSFVKRGVPALFLYMGFTAMDGRNAGRPLWDRLNATIVHQPGDDLSQPIDYAIAAKFADVFRRVIVGTADGPRPLWYRDSPFARFAPALPVAGRPASNADVEPSLAARLGDQLAHHPLIAIGESHRSARFHRFLESLIRDRDFICRVDDIVVEFGNSAHQAIADRYVGGEAVSREEKASLWRDTGQWLVWDSPVYERFFDTVREINSGHLCPRPVRVLLGDPPIRWDEVRSAADYRRFAERDQVFADIVEREVLARGRRALLIVGSTHILKGRPREFGGGATVGEILERRHPGRLFAILPTADPQIAAAAGLGPRRRLAVVRELPLGAESYARLASPRTSMRVTVDGEQVWRPANTLGWPATAEVVDALLLLDGEDEEVRPDPAIYREPAYQAELRRRAAILAEVYGMDFLPELEALLAPEPGP